MTNFSEIVHRKGTYCTQWDYIQDRFGKADILPFSISDMDFMVAKEIKEILQKRLNHGIFGYSRWKNDDYLNAICTWYSKRFNYPLKENWIMYTPSVIYSIISILAVLNLQKAPILFISPAYDNFYKSLKASNYDFLTSHLQLQENAFVINWVDFENKLKQCKFLLWCNPHNPTGKLWQKEELEKVVTLAKKYNTIIISDDIHMDIVYKPAKYIPILQIAEQLDYLHNTIIVTSSSKSFNTPALGGAYCIIPNSNYYDKINRKIKEQDSLGSPMIMGMLSLIAAYNYCDKWLDGLIQYLNYNLDIIESFFYEHFEDISFVKPQSTYLAWINMKNLKMSSVAIQNKLINIGKVGILPGDIYGEESPYLRLNFACSETKLKEGLNRIRLAIYSRQ